LIGTDQNGSDVPPNPPCPWPLINNLLACPDPRCRADGLTFPDELKWIKHLVACHYTQLVWSGPAAGKRSADFEDFSFASMAEIDDWLKSKKPKQQEQKPSAARLDLGGGSTEEPADEPADEARSAGGVEAEEEEEVEAEAEAEVPSAKRKGKERAAGERPPKQKRVEKRTTAAETSSSNTDGRPDFSGTSTGQLRRSTRAAAVEPRNYVLENADYDEDSA
jgi:hypothetical protein